MPSFHADYKENLDMLHGAETRLAEAKKQYASAGTDAELGRAHRDLESAKAHVKVFKLKMKDLDRFRDTAELYGIKL